MIYELRRGGFALFLRINHSGTLYSQWDTGFSGFVGRDMRVKENFSLIPQNIRLFFTRITIDPI